MAAKKNRRFTTTGPSKQIHTLFDYHPTGFKSQERESWGTVHDWKYHNIPSVHPIFHQAVENYTKYPSSTVLGHDFAHVWPRYQPPGDQGHWPLPQNPTR